MTMEIPSDSTADAIDPGLLNQIEDVSFQFVPLGDGPPEFDLKEFSGSSGIMVTVRSLMRLVQNAADELDRR